MTNKKLYYKNNQLRLNQIVVTLLLPMRIFQPLNILVVSINKSVANFIK